MIKKILNLRREIVYQDEDENRAYGRIIGGLAWPQALEPGFLVVLGEEVTKDIGLNARRVWLLKEQTVDTIEGVGRMMRGMRTSCACEEWVADKSEAGCLKIFRTYNEQAMQKGGAPLPLRSGPMVGESLGALLQAVFEMLEPDRKILTLGESRVAQALGILGPEDMKKLAGNYPPLAALGYAAAELSWRRPYAAGEEPKVRGDWDIFQEGESPWGL